jgi:TetR/AcrR family transcriptional regulator
MSEADIKTEKLILDAAKKVFLKKGLDGARMQEIADEAGINKALLHYYFRSKDKLFDAVFFDAFHQFIPKVMESFASDNKMEDKITLLVETYITMLQNNPHLPIFILNELHRDPEKLVHMMKQLGIRPDLLALALQKEISSGNMVPIKAEQLIINIIGMCVFPFIGRPLLKGFMFDNDDEKYNQFLEERKKEVPAFVIRSLFIKK